MIVNVHIASKRPTGLSHSEENLNVGVIIQNKVLFFLILPVP